MTTPLGFLKYSMRNFGSPAKNPKEVGTERYNKKKTKSIGIQPGDIRVQEVSYEEWNLRENQ
jgi:hypothetical protein